MHGWVNPGGMIASRIVVADGRAFEVFTCGSGDRLALCLHGFPEHPYSWRYQMPLLAELGYHVWAPSLRGYGHSYRPVSEDAYAIELLLGDVAALIDASRATSVTLIGHDWGGALAWFFAMREVRTLERLIVMNSPHPALFARSLRTWAQLRRSWYMAFFQVRGVPEYVLRRDRASAITTAIRDTAVDRAHFSDAVLAVYREQALLPGALTAMLHWYRAAGRGGGFERQRLLGFPVIATPTLLLWGETDHALTKESTYGTERYVRDLTVRYLPSVSHWVQQEAPDPVNAMLAAFLRDEPVPKFF